MTASSKRMERKADTSGRIEHPPVRKGPPPRDAGTTPLREREATVHEAKTHLSRLLTEVEAGGTVIITRRGKPVARLERLKPRGPRVPGRLKGIIAFDESFFDPLPDDLLEAWGEI